MDPQTLAQMILQVLPATGLNVPGNPNAPGYMPNASVPYTPPTNIPGNPNAPGYNAVPPPSLAAPAAGASSPAMVPPASAAGSAPASLPAPQPITPMTGAPQSISPLASGGGIPMLPEGGLANAPQQEGQGLWDVLGRPSVSRGLIQAGLRMLAAGAPSTDPRSGSLGYGISEGLGGFMEGADDANALERQRMNDEVNAAYKLAIAEAQVQPSTPDIQTFYDDATGREFKGYYDQATGEIVKLGGLKAPPRVAGTGVAGSNFGNETRLRQEYLKAVKDVAPIYDGWQRVKAGAALGTGVGDMSIIFGYMKMLDPTSVVREGEYANARNAAGVPEQVLAEYNRIVGGGVLSDTQRQQFTEAAEAAWLPYQARLDDAKNTYGGLAQQYGMDPGRIAIDPVPAAIQGMLGGSDNLPTIMTDEEYEALPSGAEFIDQSGNIYRKP